MSNITLELMVIFFMQCIAKYRHHFAL